MGSASGQDLSNEKMVEVGVYDRTDQYLELRKTMGAVEAMQKLGHKEDLWKTKKS